MTSGCTLGTLMTLTTQTWQERLHSTHHNLGKDEQMMRQHHWHNNIPIYVQATIVGLTLALTGHCQGERMIRLQRSVSIARSGMYPSLLEGFSHVLHRLPPLGAQLKGSHPSMLRYGASTCDQTRHAN